MAEQRSRGGLKSVRDELLANLERIGAQVRADGDFAEAVTLLFEMHAVLMALRLTAAAMLAEEMQRTCEQIIKDAAVDAEPARESVVLALVQLNEYLRSSGAVEHRDPLALLASINELRHSRGVPPMSAAELLIPSSVLAQSERVAPDSLASLVRLALKLRPHFHRYVVRWFGRDNAHNGLLGLSRLFNHIRRSFAQETAAAILRESRATPAEIRNLIGGGNMQPAAGEPPEPVQPAADGLDAGTEAEVAAGAALGAVTPQRDATARVGADEDELEALLGGDDLLGVFVEEADELIDALDGQLQGWHARGLDAAGLALARRRLHTLKGSAYMAGMAPIGDLAHALESLLAGEETLPTSAVGHILGLLERTLDTLSAQIDAARQGAQLALTDDLLADIERAAPDHGAAEAAPGASAQHAPTATPVAGDAAPVRRCDPATSLRVGTEWLDGIITSSAEVGAY